MNAIIGYNEDSEDNAESGERHAPNKKEDDEKDNNDNLSTSKPANDPNFVRRISCIWLDVHHLVLHTDPGLFIPGMPMDRNKVEEDIVIGQEHSHLGDDRDDADTPGPSKTRRFSKKQQFG